MNIQPMDDLERRLQALPDAVRENSDFVRDVMGRIERENADPGNSRSIQIKRWIMRSAMGLAAGLLVAAFVWIMASSPRPAMAMDDVAKHVLELKSLHIKGMIFPPDGSVGRPFEIFAEQPDRCRINGRLATCGQTSDSSDLIITPTEVVSLDYSTKTATSAPTTKADARTQVTRILQGLGQSMFGNAPGFEKVRSEKIGGVDADVYENRSDPHSRMVIWLNPSTSLPVQTEIYALDPGKPDRLAMRFDTIEANPTVDDSAFDYKPGPGWSMLYSQANDTESLKYNSCGFGGMMLSVRYLIQLDNGDALMCWCLFEEAHPEEDLSLPDKRVTVTIRALGGPMYSERLLHADTGSKGFHWRWSLLHPDQATRASTAILSVKGRDAKGDSGEDQDMPETFTPGELAGQVEAMQKQTLPPGAAPMTLKQIETLGQDTEK